MNNKVPSQDAFGLIPKIHKYGCGLLSACKLTGSDWTVDDVNRIYHVLTQAKAMTEDCYISWIPFAKLLGLRFIKFASADYVLIEDELAIDQWKDRIDGDLHFVVGGKNGECVYDPLHKGSQTVARGCLIGRRILKKV